jgi:catechol 2,3-dioxygenase-like lactoylglutathione lyase family enzyme
MDFLVSGIQQIGIGVSNVREAYTWYNRNLGFRVKMFEEAAEASLMLPYTGGKPEKRHAILSLNMHGGGGFEIWQYTERTPQAPFFQPLPGDTGIFMPILKCTDIHAAFTFLKQKGISVSALFDSKKYSFFYFKDLYGNPFKVVEYPEHFSRTKVPVGGVFGAVIGVSDMEKSVSFYKNVLGFREIQSDETKTWDDLLFLQKENYPVQKVILFKPNENKGPFSPVLGSNIIELWKVNGRKPRKIFENRQWGDLGYIHLCFDVVGMRGLQKHCSAQGHPFTVDGGEGFEMGEAAGHFTYIEDPDGTLIEFVETKKIPVIKKIGWYLNLEKRNRLKPLPNWMLKALSWNSENI